VFDFGHGRQPQGEASKDRSRQNKDKRNGDRTQTDSEPAKRASLTPRNFASSPIRK